MPAPTQDMYYSAWSLNHRYDFIPMSTDVRMRNSLIPPPPRRPLPSIPLHSPPNSHDLSAFRLNIITPNRRTAVNSHRIHTPLPRRQSMNSHYRLEDFTRGIQNFGQAARGQIAAARGQFSSFYERLARNRVTGSLGNLMRPRAMSTTNSRSNVNTEEPAFDEGQLDQDENWSGEEDILNQAILHERSISIFSQRHLSFSAENIYTGTPVLREISRIASSESFHSSFSTGINVNDSRVTAARSEPGDRQTSDSPQPTEMATPNESNSGSAINEANVTETNVTETNVNETPAAAPTAPSDDAIQPIPEYRPPTEPYLDGMANPENSTSREMKIFKRVLRDVVLRDPFQKFLEQQFCAENLNFYVAVENFRDALFHSDDGKPRSDKEIKKLHVERTAAAHRVYDRHFATNSMEPVNVDNSTAKKIKESFAEAYFPRNTFDLAQYQIFHLLKYDCWPRFIRAGGVQPEFTDEELAEEDERLHRLDLGAMFEHMPEMMLPRSVGDDRPCASTSTPAAPVEKKKAEKEKRRSLLWHGFDRFSRKLRREPPRPSNAPTSSSNTHQSVHRTSSSRAEEQRRSYSTELEAAAPRVVGSAGSKRRHMFASGKQYSMPAEISHPNSPNPAARPVPKCEPRHCRLMTGDNYSTEIVELSDPTVSVRSWTQDMAETLGMDRRATEAVDAETGSTIDPARQAIDALQSRSIRLVPVITFALEILPPNFSFKNPNTTPTKILMVRARHSLSAGGVLRPLLGKYCIDFGAVVIVFSGTLDVLRASVSIGNIGPRTLTVMSKEQYQDRMHGGKKDLPMPRDPIATSPNLAAEHNLQFHQHGDVSYCELPSEADRIRQAKARKSNPHSSESSGGRNLFRFVRKAAMAATGGSSKDDTRLVGQKKDSSRRKSAGQTTSAGVYCGDEPVPEAPKESKKRLSIFKNVNPFRRKERDVPPEDRPSTSAVCFARESPRPQAREPCALPINPRHHSSCLSSSLPSSSAAATSSARAGPSTSSASSSTPAANDVAGPSTSSAGAGPSTSTANNVAASNGDAAKTPAIFSSKVCSDAEDKANGDRGWQKAAYV